LVRFSGLFAFTQLFFQTLGHIKIPRNLRDFGGNFVRKSVRESMFGKAPFNGSLMIKG